MDRLYRRAFATDRTVVKLVQLNLIVPFCKKWRGKTPNRRVTLIVARKIDIFADIVENHKSDYRMTAFPFE